MPSPNCVKTTRGSEYALDSEVAKFDLTLSIEVHPQRIVCLWEYATALFEHGTIERLATHYQQLLAQLLAHPDTPIRDLSILTPQGAQCPGAGHLCRQWCRRGGPEAPGGCLG